MARWCEIPITPSTLTLLSLHILVFSFYVRTRKMLVYAKSKFSYLKKKKKNIFLQI